MKAKFFIIAALAAVATLSTGCKKDEPEENGGIIIRTSQQSARCPHCGKITYYVTYNTMWESAAGIPGPGADQYVGGNWAHWELHVNNQMGAYHGFWKNTNHPSKIWWTCDSCSTTITAEYDYNNKVIKTY